MAPDGLLVNELAGTVAPVHVVILAGTLAVTDGDTFTTKVIVTGDTQGLIGVPVSVYVVVVVGPAFTLEPVVEDSPVAGLHDQLKSFTIEPWMEIGAGTPAQVRTVSVKGVQAGGGALAEPGYDR